MLATAESEAPERYFWWAGLAAVSAVVKKNVWLNLHYFPLYPNIYVALVSARSGGRKGYPVSLAKSILQQCPPTRIISGTNTIQGIIQELSVPKSFPGDMIVSEAHAILIAPEFDAFLIEDPKALTDLTDLYNAQEHRGTWTKKLRKESEDLDNPCLTLLAASNETLWNSVVKAKDKNGGFVARTFIVYESRKRGRNSLAFPPKNVPDIERLSERLRKISEIKGEFRWGIGAQIYYDDWYNNMEDEMESLDIADETGSTDRLAEKVLKAAMLISLARKDDLILLVEDIELAISKSRECLNSMQTMMLGTGANGDISKSTLLVIKILYHSPGRMVSRKKLLSRLHSEEIDSRILSRIMGTLLEAETIEQPYDNGSGLIYRMTERAYTNYSRAFSKL